MKGATTNLPTVNAQRAEWNNILVPGQYVLDLGAKRLMTDDFVNYFKAKGLDATRIDNVYDHTDIPIDELVLHNGTPRVSIAGNNGNLTGKESTYKGIIPFAPAGVSGTVLFKNQQKSQQ